MSYQIFLFTILPIYQFNQFIDLPIFYLPIYSFSI